MGDVSFVDLLLLLALASFAWSGYRQGFLVGVLSLAGFLAGGIAAMVFAPGLLGDWEPGLRQALAAVAIVVALATLGQLLLGMAGARLRAHLTWRPARLLDASGGAVLSVIGVLLVSWFLASALRQAPVPALSREVGDSRILANVDRAMPPEALGLFGSFRTLLGDSGFPAVFGGLSAERISPVDPPATGIAAEPGVAAAAGSIVRIDGAAQECSRSIEGSGFVFAPERVMTNAHVVAGVDEPEVRIGGTGDAWAAEVVLYDPDRDLAVLAVPGLPAAALAFDDSAARGDDAVVAGFPGGGPYRLDAARVREEITARGPDIYGGDQVTRRVLSLYTSIAPGNSGGPLLSPGGGVYGVIFAKSLDDDSTGYALAMDEVAPVAAAGRVASGAVDTGGCAA